MKLRKVIRNNWRDWTGSRRKENGGFLPLFRPMEIGGVKFDKETVNNYDTFEAIFGTHCYQLWPAAVLRGPAAWLNSLSNRRTEEHMNWVDLVQEIQSTCPNGFIWAT